MNAPVAPLLATIPRVELGSVGTWDISNIQGWHPTAEDFAAAVSALDCKAVRRPVLKLGHSQGPGDPTIGIIDNLAVADNGQTLVGDFAGVPAWLASADASGNSVIASAYPDRSGEWEHNYVCQLGHTHPFVLHAMALLGVVKPGIGTLQSLYDLYATAPEKEKPMAQTALASMTVDQVRDAYYNGPAASNYNLWVREMFIDPPELIVQNDMDNSLLRVAYTVEGDGVTFAEGVKVKVEYISDQPVAPAEDEGAGAPVAASAPIIRFASRAESRPGRPAGVSTPAAAADGVTTEGGSNVEITNEQLAALRTALGLADEADLTAIIDAAKAVGDQLPTLREALGLEEAATIEDIVKAAQDLAAKVTEGDEAPADVASAAASLGLATIDSGRLARLEANSAKLETFLENDRKAGIDQRLNSAIAEGRITPANKDKWRKSFDRDPESAADLLDSMSPNTALPVSELGHSAEPIDTSDVRDSAAYKSWSI